MEEDTQDKYPLLEGLREERYAGKIPDGYLDGLAEKQWGSDSQPKIEKKQLGLFYITRIAAAFTILLASYFVIREMNTLSQAPQLFVSVTETELLEYAEENIYDFNVDLLSDVYYEEDLEDITTDDQETLELIELETLEEYLIEETL